MNILFFKKKLLNQSSYLLKCPHRSVVCSHNLIFHHIQYKEEQDIYFVLELITLTNLNDKSKPN